jgi:polyhydroxyalkanoate synthase
MSRQSPQPDELAAPLDLLLTGATRPFVSRMTPDRTWARFGAHLAIHPGTVVNRGADLVRELGTIVAGKSDQAPDRSNTHRRPRPFARFRC